MQFSLINKRLHVASINKNVGTEEHRKFMWFHSFLRNKFFTMRPSITAQQLRVKFFFSMFCSIVKIVTEMSENKERGNYILNVQWMSISLCCRDHPSLECISWLKRKGVYLKTVIIPHPNMTAHFSLYNIDDLYTRNNYGRRSKIYKLLQSKDYSLTRRLVLP